MRNCQAGTTLASDHPRLLRSEIIGDGLAEVYGRILERSKDRNLAALLGDLPHAKLILLMGKPGK